MKCKSTSKKKNRRAKRTLAAKRGRFTIRARQEPSCYDPSDRSRRTIRTDYHSRLHNFPSFLLDPLARAVFFSFSGRAAQRTEGSEREALNLSVVRVNGWSASDRLSRCTTTRRATRRVMRPPPFRKNLLRHFCHVSLPLSPLLLRIYSRHRTRGLGSS